MEFRERIARYLETKLPDCRNVEVENLVRIPGGASRETWSVDVRWTDGSGTVRRQGLVFRCDPPASLVRSRREVEFAFYRSFYGSRVPVPRPLWLETEPGGLERPFFVMERVDGCESDFQKLLEPDFAPHREALAERMYSILGEIAKTPIENLPAAEVVDIPDASSCWRLELDFWERTIDENELEPQPIARAAIRWLRRHPPPAAQRVSVVHGDYRTGNFLYRGAEIHAILDWEMAHFGDPLEDLAWSLMRSWQWARDGKAGGIVEREKAIAIWERESGLRADPAALHWWEVLACVKAQGIWLTGARVYQLGEARDVILAFTSYWLMNAQDRFLLEALGRLGPV
ncbi:MAG: aminoglycoside phosphotransferase [Candidatus Binatia bacterium]|nr:MAG: aminoglycoside phosphotransferase [Candidatus Binatia bacterium]